MMLTVPVLNVLWTLVGVAVWWRESHVGTNEVTPMVFFHLLDTAETTMWLFVLVMIASGWSIVYDALPWWRIIVIVPLLFLFALAVMLAELVHPYTISVAVVMSLALIVLAFIFLQRTLYDLKHNKKPEDMSPAMRYACP